MNTDNQPLINWRELFIQVLIQFLFWGILLFALHAYLSGPSEESQAESFVVAVNEMRVESGLRPLEVHPSLAAASLDWANELNKQGALSHASDLSVGVTGNWTKLGENVGVGPSDQLPAIFDAFVASPAHYANLMDPDFRFIGVGVVHDGGRMWTTHRFMAVDEDQLMGIS